MPNQEPILEFRLFEFSCSLCRGDGSRRGSFAAVGTVSELIAAFREHVKRFHTEETSAEVAARTLGGG
jgi:hypothetical protein